LEIEEIEEMMEKKVNLIHRCLRECNFEEALYQMGVYDGLNCSKLKKHD
jgi:hypothetical protein